MVRLKPRWMNENPFVKGKSAPDTDHFDEKTTTFAKGVAFWGEMCIKLRQVRADAADCAGNRAAAVSVPLLYLRRNRRSKRGLNSIPYPAAAINAA